MSEEEFENLFDSGDLDDQYGAFILNYKDGIRFICNG
jgi:hypothetical protein